ncbi:MAG: carboxylating nicotinate-nucleotide diphosphorylase [Pseudomonadota bacterium]
MTADVRTAAAPLIRLALEEDVGAGDITTEACIPAGARGAARIIARGPTVVCGLFLAEQIYSALSDEVTCRAQVGEGTRVYTGRELLRLEGPLGVLLTGERVTLNFLGRLCGIAANVRRFRRRAGDGVALLDTRKTTPGWRVLERYAVRIGGGVNHRTGLYDQFLIKENHIAGAGGIVNAIRRARDHAGDRPIQVEVRNREELVLAVESGVDSILLDNMTPPQIREMVRLVGGRCVLEASGGINHRNLAAYAATGVTRISVGALTHSAPNADLSMLVMRDGSRA